MRLEDLTPGASVTGILPDGPVTVVDVRWHGTNALTLTYTDRHGQPAQELLYRTNEADLALVTEGHTWRFDGDPAIVQRQLGHASLATTTIYAQPDEDELRAAVERPGSKRRATPHFASIDSSCRMIAA